jgi:hypothetical protein
MRWASASRFKAKRFLDIRNRLFVVLKSRVQNGSAT